MRMETEANGTPVWVTTNTGNLLRHQRSGRYYARFSLNGKRKIEALKTDKISVAKIRLHKRLAEIEAHRLSGPRVESGDATMADLMKRYRADFQAASGLGDAAKRAREFAVSRLERTWPGIARLKPAAITKDAIVAWSNQTHANAEQPLQPGAKTRRKGYSANSINQSLDALQRILRLGISRGALHANPFDELATETDRAKRARKKIKPTRLNLPPAPVCEAIFKRIESPSLSAEIPEPLAKQLRSDAADCGELVRGLAYTGMRLGEASRFKWEDVRDREFTARGTKSETSFRKVPIVPAMRELLDKMRARREANGWPLTGPVFRVRECQKSLDRACKECGASRLHHHSLRHVFGTRCMESGIPVRTIAEWMGHADGGALLLKLYAHVSDEHSLAQAGKVSFGAGGV